MEKANPQIDPETIVSMLDRVTTDPSSMEELIPVV